MSIAGEKILFWHPYLGNNVRIRTCPKCDNVPKIFGSPINLRHIGIECCRNFTGYYNPKKTLKIWNEECANEIVS